MSFEALLGCSLEATVQNVLRNLCILEVLMCLYHKWLKVFMQYFHLDAQKQIRIGRKRKRGLHGVKILRRAVGGLIGDLEIKE